MAPVLSCHQLSKSYGHGPLSEGALVDVSLSFDRGQTCVLLGPSGSGKTTLLSICGCLLSPTTGQVQINGKPVPRATWKLADLRAKSVGFVFQQPHLLPFLTVTDNLRIVARNAGMPPDKISDRVANLTDRLGIGHLTKRRPSQLSGGQRQRASIARALVHRPPILLADEPTAALDWNNGQAALELLIEQAKAEQSVLLVVTHDRRLTDLFDRVIELDSGRVSTP